MPRKYGLPWYHGYYSVAIFFNLCHTSAVVTSIKSCNIKKNAVHRFVMGLIIAHSFQMRTDSFSNYECSGRHMDGRSENE